MHADLDRIESCSKMTSVQLTPAVASKLLARARVISPTDVAEVDQADLANGLNEVLLKFLSEVVRDVLSSMEHRGDTTMGDADVKRALDMFAVREVGMLGGDATFAAKYPSGASGTVPLDTTTRMVHQIAQEYKGRIPSSAITLLRDASEAYLTVVMKLAAADGGDDEAAAPAALAMTDGDDAEDDEEYVDEGAMDDEEEDEDEDFDEED